MGAFMNVLDEIFSAVAVNMKEQREEDAAAYHDRIMQGDCVKLMQMMPSECVDFVLTDPPYLVNYMDRSGRKIANDKSEEWVVPTFREAYRLLKPNSFCASFYGWPKLEVFFSAWKQCGFRPIGHFVWAKRYSSRVGYAKSHHECAYLLAKGRPQRPSNPPPDVLPWQYSGNRLHPTQKPIAALTPLIEAYCKPQGLVLDPFGGSGSTAIAARLCNRHFVLCELDAKYYNAAKFRLLQPTEG